MTTIALWIVLNIYVVAMMQLALFSQTQPWLHDRPMYQIVLVSEGFAILEWLALLPANRIGNTFLTAAQLNLSSFVFDSLSQLVSNRYWLHVPTTLDDMLGLALVIFGMVISKWKLCGSWGV